MSDICGGCGKELGGKHWKTCKCHNKLDDSVLLAINKIDWISPTGLFSIPVLLILLILLILGPGVLTEIVNFILAHPK